MKKFILIATLFATFLCACSGSDVFRGEWKAVSIDGQKFEINFDAKNFSITDSVGNASSFGYTQNSVNIVNSTKTYGITLQDGRAYQITFRNSADESIALIKDENGAPLYSISRNEYISYDDIYKLK